MRVYESGRAIAVAFGLSTLLAVHVRAAVNITAASGGNAIPADRAADAPAPAWTSLGAITISEPGNSRGDIGGGTLVINAPAGFEFNAGLLPNVSFTSARNITEATGAITTSNLTISLTVVGSEEVDNLTIGGSPAIQIRPSGGTPLVSGTIYRPITDGGTATIVGVVATDNTNGSGGTGFGNLRSVPGAAHQLTAQALPASSAVAGVNFSPQPVIQVRDQFGNLRNSANGTADNSTIVTASLASGTSVLQGTTNVTAANGAATFSNLAYHKAEDISVRFTSGSLTSVVSGTITISPAIASHLAFATQPGSTTYGLPLAPQPVVASQDAYGNGSVEGLGASNLLSLTLSSGTGTLLGTTSLDIGTASGNGIVTFTNLAVTDAGTEKRLSAAASGLTNAVSTPFTIQPLTLTASVTVSNKAYDGSTAAAIANRSLSGVLGGDDVSLSGGVALFADKDAGAGKTVTITNLALTGAAAPNYQLAATTVNTSASITKVPLTVTAENKVREVNQANPLFTARYSGFVNNESLATSGIAGSPDLSTAATLASPTGHYPITAAIGSLSSVNYDFTMVDGVLSVIPGDTSLLDDFTRIGEPAELSPWIAQMGNWAVTNGALASGSNVIQTYSYAAISNNWRNYSVEGLIRFAAGSFGGGFGGRLNPATGAQYLAWIYPEGSTGGSNILKLFKFRTWTSFGYTNVDFIPMHQATLPGVGTNWHSLRVNFVARHISVAYDGIELISVPDVEAHPYTNGGISVGIWTDLGADHMVVDNVFVKESPDIPVASNDTYSVVSDRVLTVPAPGVLLNDIGSNLTAVVVNATSQGTLNLNANGAFTYASSNQFVGTDLFTYHAHNGQTNSDPATVTIIVITNTPPVAGNDSYSVAANNVLTIAAPGVLANDSDANSDTLTAVLVNDPAHGVLNLASNGGFIYTPATGYFGDDSFTYRANDSSADSDLATVSIVISEPDVLFADHFSRPTDPGPLLPWIAHTGSWAVHSGALHGGPSPFQHYGFAYLDLNWTNYSVEACLQFQPGAYGAGIGGRLNPTTGAHYAAWVYPEGSSGGSSVLKLIKFSTWTTFGYNGINFVPMQQTNLPGVGTASRTVKLTLNGNRIKVAYDGSEVLDVTDIEAQPLSSGGISADMWTDATPGITTFDDVIVRAIDVASPPTVVGIERIDAQVTVTLAGTPGATYLVEASTNLASPLSWQPVSTNVAGTNGQWTFTDGITNYSQRFFRSVKP